MKYGNLPVNLGSVALECKEFMVYQYLPIKLANATQIVNEERLQFVNSLLGTVCCDFVGNFGLDKYVTSYVYLTVKSGWQVSGCYLNRTGYHTDGFLSDDVSYIWSNMAPTIFNSTEFNLTQDDTLSLTEMQTQAKLENEVIYPENSLLRIDQYNVHKVNEQPVDGWRTFIKVSFSLDKYNLVGNSRNYLLNYNWKMIDRTPNRNVPSAQGDNHD